MAITVDEAIVILSEAAYYRCVTFNDKWYEALKLAIQALIERRDKQ